MIEVILTVFVVTIVIKFIVIKKWVSAEVEFPRQFNELVNQTGCLTLSEASQDKRLALIAVT